MSNYITFEGGQVFVDDWIPLEMDVKDAANICLLRAELDGLLISAVTNPEGINEKGEGNCCKIQKYIYCMIHHNIYN